MIYGFHPEALDEFDKAAAYYEERQPGLQVRFIDAVENAISRACDTPERFRRFDGEIRRVLVHIFPYAVLYTIGEGVIHIIAVMHCSREPGYWKQRTK